MISAPFATKRPDASATFHPPLGVGSGSVGPCDMRGRELDTRVRSVAPDGLPVRVADESSKSSKELKSAMPVPKNAMPVFHHAAMGGGWISATCAAVATKNTQMLTEKRALIRQVVARSAAGVCHLLRRRPQLLHAPRWTRA